MDIAANQINFVLFFTGTKSDLRETQDTLISISEAKKMKRNIGAYKYLECSAIRNEGLTEIFEEAVRCVYRKQPIKKRTCTLL